MRGGDFGPAVPGRIPWSIVMAWSRHHDLSPGEIAMLDRCLMAMDGEYMEHWQIQAEAEQKRRQRKGRAR